MHRDIKPSNILISNTSSIHLCDFGLSRAIPEEKEEMSPRVTSRYYRAPEVILMKPDYDESIDIWSVGCVLGDLLLTLKA
jgi:serine/threonine protein kinase